MKIVLCGYQLKYDSGLTEVECTRVMIVKEGQSLANASVKMDC